jgi:hypothetical protein
MLKIVQNKEHSPVSNHRTKNLDDGAIVLFDDPHGSNDGRSEEGWVSNRGEWHEPDAVRIRRDQFVRHLNRYATLADSACSGERDMAFALDLELLCDGGDLIASSNQWCSRLRERLIRPFVVAGK